MTEVSRYLSHEDLMELQTIIGDYSKLIIFIEACCKMDKEQEE